MSPLSKKGKDIDPLRTAQRFARRKKVPHLATWQFLTNQWVDGASEVLVRSGDEAPANMSKKGRAGTTK